MSLTKVSFSMIQGDVINVLDYGAKGDSNGTPGNGTDDTAAIQAAVTAAGDAGKILFLPVGTYRITAPINFTGDTNKFGFHGESNLQTIIYADFTSVTKRAALSLNNTTGTRAYVSFKNFRLQGKNNALTSGIYCNWTGSFSQIENVFVDQFYDGFVIANDYYMKVINCFAINNLNNGLQFGYEIDGVTIAACNANAVVGGIYTQNGANGVYVLACRALGMYNVIAEANTFTNIFLQSVFGADLSGIYMEYANSIAALYSAQLKLNGCNGVTINGLSVSAFKDGAGPVIDLDGDNNGIVISGATIELGFSGTKYAAAGIRVFNSFNVTIDGCVIDGCSVGINLLTSARCTINNVTFSNYTNPLLVSDNANCRVQWKNTQPAFVTASSIGANAKVDLEYIDNTKNVIDGTNVFNVSVTFTELAAGATKKIIDSTLAGERWRIIDIIAVGLTAADAGGDRGLGLTDGTSVYTVIPAATLKTANFQGRWGSTNVPFSAVASAMIQPTVAGTDLVAYWSGGTTDYTAGVFNIQVTAERIA
jgi:parallel beta-helix repeat protein